MTAEQFKKANNFRQCEKCCGNCRLWRDHMYEGDGDCVHPDVKDNFLCTQADDVCDKWEKTNGLGEFDTTRSLLSNDQEKNLIRESGIKVKKEDKGNA